MSETIIIDLTRILIKYSIKFTERIALLPTYVRLHVSFQSRISFDSVSQSLFLFFAEKNQWIDTNKSMLGLP